MKKILLVEDNDTIVLGLKYTLEQQNFIVSAAKTVKEAKEKLDNYDFNLILLDISLPDGDGFELCKYIKEKKDTPVIFLTARDEETNVVLGLDMGADDYVIKPFRNRELISRINRVICRYESLEQNSNIIKYKNITIDVNNAQVFKNGEEIIFTNLEFRILLMLFSNQNRLITREQILDKIWDIAGNFVNDNTLTVYIKRIRAKLGDDKSNPEIIKTIRGIGYKVGGDN